jgi:hypothetical protein
VRFRAPSGFQGWQTASATPAVLPSLAVMDEPEKDAEKRRAEAQHARRLAADLSQPADQDRLKQHADDLEGKVAKQDALGRKPVDEEKRTR